MRRASSAGSQKPRFDLGGVRVEVVSALIAHSCPVRMGRSGVSVIAIGSVSLNALSMGGLGSRGWDTACVQDEREQLGRWPSPCRWAGSSHRGASPELRAPGRRTGPLQALWSPWCD